MATDGLNPEQMTEEQLRAAYEAEIKRIRVEHVLLETVVTLINLGMRRTGLMPGSEDERDAEQVTVAVDSVRALLPIVERIAPEQAGSIQDALSQLQIAFVQSSTERPSGVTVETPGGGSGVAPDAAGDGGSAATPGGAGEGVRGDAGEGVRGDAGEARTDATHEDPLKPGEPGPAQRSGRLWVPGQ